MKLFYILFIANSLLSVELKADPLRDLTSSFRGHVEDEYTRRSLAATQIQSETGLESKSVSALNLDSARNLEFLVELYLQGKLQPDVLLHTLLDARFRYLQNRRNNLIAAQNELEETGTIERVFLSTRPSSVDIFKKHADENPENLSNVFNYLSVLYIIDMYQVYSKIIVEVFNRHSNETFSPKTLKLLRASVTLHPLIRGESEDWLHPDYAFISQKDEPKHMYGKRDLNYYEDCVEVSHQDVILLNWTKSKVELHLTKAGAGKSNLELPFLSSLRKPELTRSSEVLESTPSPLQILESKSGKEEEDNSNHEENVVPLDLPISQDPPLNVETSSPQNVGIKVSKSEMKPAHEKKKEKPVLTVEKENTPMPARGNRLFHDQAQATPAPTVSLSNKLQGIVDCLFDHQRYQTVYFGEFASVWRHVNGNNSIKSPGSGGSHRALLDAQGNVVGSTFSHGDKQTYGPKTVKYLRDALLNVGVKPSK